MISPDYRVFLVCKVCEGVAKDKPFYISTLTHLYKKDPVSIEQENFFKKEHLT